MPYQPLHRFYRGGALTQRFRRLPDPTESRWSEDWVASTTVAGNAAPDGRSQGLSSVALEDGSSCTLAVLVAAYPEAMVGSATLHRYGPETGVLVKILSPEGPVPLHAHPTREWAARHLHSPHGKTEAWILLETPPTDGEPAYAGIGFREDVTAEWFRDAVQRRDHAALRECLHRTEISAGEVYVAAAGVPHLLGPREFFIEVQEPSDHIVVPETDGTDDAGATMGLGWDQALRMIDYTPRDRASTLAHARQEPALLRTEGQSREFGLLAPWVSSYFEARRLEVTDNLTVDDDRFGVLIITAGAGRLVGDFGRIEIRDGDAFAVPAATAFRLEAKDALIAVRCLGPDPDA